MAMYARTASSNTSATRSPAADARARRWRASRLARASSSANVSGGPFAGSTAGWCGVASQRCSNRCSMRSPGRQRGRWSAGARMRAWRPSGRDQPDAGRRGDPRRQRPRAASACAGACGGARPRAGDDAQRLGPEVVAVPPHDPGASSAPSGRSGPAAAGEALVGLDVAGAGGRDDLRQGPPGPAGCGPSRASPTSRARTACRTRAAGGRAPSASAGQNRDESGVSTSSASTISPVAGSRPNSSLVSATRIPLAAAVSAPRA